MPVMPSLLDRVYLYKNRGKSVVTIVRAQLTERVRPQELKEAAEISLRDYASFNIKPLMSDNGRVSFAENNAEPPVFEKSSGRHLLGTEEVRGYLFCIYYEDELIELSASHILGDARIDKEFLSLVLLNYFRLLGIEVPEEEIRLLCDRREEELTGLYEAAASYKDRMEGAEEAQDKNEKDPADGAKLLTYMEESDREYDKSRYYVKRSIGFPYSELLELSKRYDASPFVLMADLLARAMGQAYDTKGLDLKISASIDMRGIYETASVHNFSAEMELFYPNARQGMEAEERYALLKKELAEAKRTDRLTQGILGNGELTGMLESYFNLKDYGTIEKLIDKGLMEGLPSLYLASIGRLKLPACISTYVRDMDINGIPVSPETCFYTTAFGDSYRLIMAGSHTRDALQKAILDILKEMGISAQAEEMSIEDTDYLDIGGFTSCPQPF